MMRAFIAVELPEDVRAALAGLQRTLQAARADVRWVEQKNLHVTMRFLGEISTQQRIAAGEVVRAVAERHAPIRVQLTELGAFPSPAAPRVIWAGIGDGALELAQVVKDAEEGLQPLGLPKEDRPFVAHVTLGRAKSPKYQPQLSRCLQETAWQAPGPFTVGHLTLFESVLAGDGPTYVPLLQALFADGR